MVHPIRAAILIGILCGGLVGLVGCGVDTPSPAGTSPTTGLSTSGAAAISDYSTELNDWANAFFTDADLNAFDFEDPLAPTRGELGRAKDFAVYARVMLSELRKIDPPPKLAQAHHRYADSLAAEIAALDRLLSGIESGNQHDIEVAYRAASAAHTQEMQALGALGPYIDLPVLTES